MSGVLQLKKSHLEAVIGHAKTCKPEEACGILGGSGNGQGTLIVERVFLMENAEHSSTFYMMSPNEQFQVFDELERTGLDLVTIFHSHPHSQAYPSAQDMKLAFYPDSLYLIISLMDEKPDCRVYRIIENSVTEAKLEIVDG